MYRVGKRGRGERKGRVSREERRGEELKNLHCTMLLDMGLAVERS